ncbi:uncharacterized protein si:dkey-27h10.2 [Hippocampus zosterae]|uniref:uncharacterized protein si:dkey-27h10.2 n=1 Tax=Hippocampus zosterae TaxID=109293 RepID=UPI00223D3C6D|nr:uncharacterized protein si:dkey-27h10.2 [Hippocampus zosterae]XP_051939661.1 uncharacterized protein si:dkey-27h10.2 [Hippocampus zosterae]
MLAFAPSLVTLGVALVSLAASQMPPGSTTESEQRIITVAGTVAENGISSETPENRNSTLMSSTVSYTTANGSAIPWTDQQGNHTEGTSSETTPPPMSTSYTHATKITESQRDKSTTTAKPSTAKSYETTGILIIILIIVVAIGFGIACYISKRRGRRYAVDFSSRADEASVPLSPVEPMLANAPHNGLQTFESGDKRSKEEEKEEAPKQGEDEPKAEAEAESASPPEDDSQNKAKEAEPVKTDEPGQQISDGTAEESPQNENNSNNSDVMQRKDFKSSAVFWEISLDSQV